MNRLRPLSLVLLGLLFGSVIRAQAPAEFTRTEDVVYGRKFGTALTLDVFEPTNKNGAAVFWIVSGGWISNHDSIKLPRIAPFLDHGYTVFAVVHGSQPRFIVPEIEDDIHRAVRFVRRHAARWSVDPNRFGIAGSSAGGHLALTVATQGGPSRAVDKDPGDSVSSAVQAAACFSPPTDFLNWSKSGEGFWDFESTRKFAPAFGPRWDFAAGRQDFGRSLSPIYFVTASTPPTLIIHGDADEVVPLYQSRIFEQKCKEAGVHFKLVVKPGAGHGYPGWEDDLVLCVGWFNEHLLGKGPRKKSEKRQRGRRNESAFGRSAHAMPSSRPVSRADRPCQ